MTRAEPTVTYSAEVDGRRNACLGLMLAALSVQLFLLGLSMPLNEMTSGGWYFHIDNPYHIYQLELGRALQAQGLLMGYDPFFGAGQLAGLASNVSARFTLAFAGLIPTNVPTTTVYAIYVLVCSVVAPLSIVGLGQILRWSQLHVILALVIGLLLWWVGVFRWYHTAGMVSFVCACYLAPLYAAWTYSLCRFDSPLKPIRIFSAGLAGGAGMWLHPLFCIPVIVLLLSFAMLDSERRRILPMLGRATAIAAVAILLSLPWVMALVQGGTQISGEQPYQRAVGLNVIFNSLGFSAGGAMGAWINLLIVVICMLGFLVTRSDKQSGMLHFMLAGLILLLFASFGGSSSTLAVLQPNRFIGPAYLLIGMGAACKATTLIRWANARGSSLRILSMLAVGMLLTFYFGRELIRELSPGSHGHHGTVPPEISAPPMVVAQLENWIKANTNADSRILFETSLGRVHGGGHVAGYLAAKTRREFMGAAYPFFTPKLSCWDRSCFGRPLSTMPPEFFQRVIETYNAGWIIAHSSELKNFLHQIPEIHMLADLQGISIFKVNGSHTFVQEGHGRVLDRDFNRIQIGDVSGQALTLRYNWVPGLETKPPSRIEAYTWSPDFPPLIRIINPPASFIIQRTD